MRVALSRCGQAANRTPAWVPKRADMELVNKLAALQIGMSANQS